MSWTASFANSPKGSNSLGNVDDEIRQLKNEIATFMARDHFFDVPTSGDGTANVLMLSNQGRLKPGSAKMQSGFGAQMALPTVRPDGTSFSAADDGRVAWAYDATRGLQQFVLYWKNDTDGYGWWPLSTAPVGTVMAFRGTWKQSGGSTGLGGDPTSLANNTMPGWVMCNGESFSYTFNFGVGGGTTQRTFTVSAATPDMRGAHLRGSGKRAGTAFTSAWADGGVESPKSEGFSKTLTVANLPGHQHQLTDTDGKPTVTVADHPDNPVLISWTDSAWCTSRFPGGAGSYWNPGSKLTLSTPGVAQQGWTTTLVDSAHEAMSFYTKGQAHTPTVTWAEGALTGNCAAATATAIDFAEAAVSQRWYNEVIWIMRVF